MAKWDYLEDSALEPICGFINVSGLHTNFRKLRINCVPGSHSLWVDRCHKTDLDKRHLAENTRLAGILVKAGWDSKGSIGLSNLSWRVFLQDDSGSTITTSKSRCGPFGRILIFFLKSHSKAFPVPINKPHPSMWPSFSFWKKSAFILFFPAIIYWESLVWNCWGSGSFPEHVERG